MALVGVFIGAPLGSRDNCIHQFLRQSVSFDEGIPEQAVIVVAIIIDKAPTSVDAILRRADDQIVERIAHGKRIAFVRRVRTHPQRV